MYVCVYAVAPGQPENLNVDNIGATWVTLHWQPPQFTGQPGIARYNVLATDTGDGSTVAVSTMDATTNTNVTGLLPNTRYEFRVQAVARMLDAANLGMLSSATMTISTSLTGEHKLQL